jgi:predicted dehydrogenase
MACGAQLHMQQSAATAFLAGGGIYLFGSEGVLRFNDGKLSGARKGAAGLQEIVIPEQERGGWRVEQEFVNAIRGREEVTHTTFEDGMKYMEFTEAAARSMATGKAIPLPLELGS